MRRSLIISISLLTAALAVLIFITSGSIYGNIRTVDLHPLDFDSRSNVPNMSITGYFPQVSSADIKEIKIDLKVKVYSINGYNDLFQTAPFNDGIRMEISAPSTLALIIKADTPQGFRSYELSRTFQLDRWHVIKLRITAGDRLEVSLDNTLVVKEEAKHLNFAISDISIGTGFNKTRIFDGKIKDFNIKYTLLENRLPLILIRHAIGMLFFPFLVALLFFIHAFLSGNSAAPGKKQYSLLKEIFLTIKNETAHASLSFSCVLSVTVLYVLYVIFFRCSYFIWSFNSIVVPIKDYTPWMRQFALDKDGIEIFALLLLTLLSVSIAFFANKLFSRINNGPIMRAFFVLFSIISFLFFINVRFYPPLAEPYHGLGSAVFTVLISIITLALSYLFMKYRGAANIVLPLLLVPICMIPSDRIIFDDYNYIFTPALKLLHGYRLSSIYFQYDYFLSLLAALWLKLGLGPYSFRILGQISFVAFFAGIYFFSQKYFKNALFAPLLVICLIIVNIYGQMSDPTHSFQVTPLRLDLWFILLLLAYWKGLKHWSLGIALGILIFFHYHFGLIYAGSYFLLICILGARELGGKAFNVARLRSIVSSYSLNILLPVFALIAYKYASTGYPHVSFTTFYGFLPIARNSFYWYVPIMLSLTVILLMKKSERLSERYFTTSSFLIVLTIGNLLYFFGRSHENNLINVSANLLFCLFLFFDLLDQDIKVKASQKMGRSFMPAVAMIFILACAYYYSGRAIVRAGAQYRDLKELQFMEKYPERNMQPIKSMAWLKKMTHSSSKVIFFSYYDLFYYYDGGYAPQGYGHANSWVMKKDVIDFLQQRLNAGYYVIVPANEFSTLSEIYEHLNAKHKIYDSGFLFIYNNY